MRRRDFIAGFAGAAAWPLCLRIAHAQQPGRMRRIGVLLPGHADDPGSQARNAMFLRAMQELGWIVGRNMRIDYRWAEGQIDRLPGLASELVASKVDVIVAGSAVASWPRRGRRQAFQSCSLAAAILCAAASLRRVWRGPTAT